MQRTNLKDMNTPLGIFEIVCPILFISIFLFLCDTEVESQASMKAQIILLGKGRERACTILMVMWSCQTNAIHTVILSFQTMK